MKTAAVNRCVYAGAMLLWLASATAHALVLQNTSVDYPDVSFEGVTPFPVLRVANADRVVVRWDNRDVSVELIGIAPPASTADRGPSVEALERMLLGELVYVVEEVGSESASSDAARAYLYRAPDGLFVNLELVRLGYVKAGTRPAFAHRALFRHYERTARAYEKGVWAPRARPARDVRPAESVDENPVAAGDATVYITRTGKKYHRADCPYAQKSGRPISLAEAAKKYDPCSVCRPPRLAP